MTVRITSGMMSANLLSDLNRNLYKMSELENTISSGRKINKPSDDPVGVTYALRYRSQLASNEQFQRSTDSAQSWLDATDGQMGKATDVMTRLKELMVQSGSGTNPQSALDAAAEEVKQLKEQLVDIGNSKSGSKFIFNGQNYDNMPYPSTSGPDFAKVQTDNSAVQYVIGENIKFQINTPGNDFFGKPYDSTNTDPTSEKDNAFAIMDRLITALGNGDQEAIGNELTNIDSRMSKMLAGRSEVGARTNRVDLVSSRLNDEELNITALQSKTEDADIAASMIKASSAQTVYEAALKSSASMISTSLVDFMR